MSDDAAPRRHEIPRDFARRYLLAERAEGVYIYDDEGRRYLDASAGSSAVVSIGHGVKEIADAMAAQAATLAYVSGHVFTHRPVQELAALLAEIAPGDLDRVWFVSGGSEATENAVKLARQYQMEAGRAGRHLVIGRWESFHGATLGALGYGGHTARRQRYMPLLPPAPRIPPAYEYRCEYCRDRGGCTLQCADQLHHEIRRQGPDNIAAFIAEPVVGAALGAVPAPAGYFQRIREICDQHDVLFIADEVMTGFGRTGTMWGIDHWGVVPDMIATAKGMSGGYVPLGAVIASQRIVDVLEARSSNIVSGHTFVGHPLTTAVGLAVMRYLLAHDLVENARVQGAYMLERLQEVMGRQRIIGDVRGIGLMAGVELVADRETRAPFPASLRVGPRVGDAALADGLVVYALQGCVDGVEGDMIKLTPPLSITRDEVDELIERFERALARVAAEL